MFVCDPNYCQVALLTFNINVDTRNIIYIFQDTHVLQCELLCVLELFECPEFYFKCPNSFCVERRYVCDGTVHCENGVDELDCGRSSV